MPALRENVDWVEPELVARVKYANWTNDNHLRAPVFLSLLTDRPPKDCTMEDAKPESTLALESKAEKENPAPKKAHVKPAKVVSSETEETVNEKLPVEEPNAEGQTPRSKQKTAKISESSPRVSSKTVSISSAREAEVEIELRSGHKETMDVESDGQRLHFSNLNKIYFPEPGIKKRELLAYYYRMARYILPFLEDRPMVLRRYPDGVNGKAFFQKEAPSYLPDWIQTATVDSEERGGEMQYILCNSRATLLYLTNLGCIDHNPWSSRAQSQENPDYVFFDLDPTDDTPFSDVMHIAREIYDMLQSIKMRCYMKTSGASGFHIFIPLEPKYTYEQTRTFAEVVGRLVASKNPKLTTFERTVSKRPKGRILIDALQNASGKPLACAYSVRAFPKATVSTPLTPEELTTDIRAEQFTLRNFNDRIAKVGDLWSDFWQNRQTLDRALELLAKKCPKGEQ